MRKLRASLVGAQDYERFPFSKLAVGQSIALYAVPAYRASTYLVSAAFPAHSTSFSPNFQSSTVESVFINETDFVLLMEPIHFASS